LKRSDKDHRKSRPLGSSRGPAATIVFIDCRFSSSPVAADPPTRSYIFNGGLERVTILRDQPASTRNYGVFARVFIIHIICAYYVTGRRCVRARPVDRERPRNTCFVFSNRSRARIHLYIRTRQKGIWEADTEGKRAAARGIHRDGSDTPIQR